jgi:large subunit ribosomal protein L24
MAAKIKKGDRVVVLTGKDKGKTGEVIEARPRENRVVVSGVNIATKHQKPTQFENGKIVRKEAAIHVSNVAIAAPKDGKATRVGFTVNDKGEKIRVSKRTGEKIDV